MARQSRVGRAPIDRRSRAGRPSVLSARRPGSFGRVPKRCSFLDQFLFTFCSFWEPLLVTKTVLYAIISATVPCRKKAPGCSQGVFLTLQLPGWSFKSAPFALHFCLVVFVFFGTILGSLLGSIWGPFWAPRWVSGGRGQGQDKGKTRVRQGSDLGPIMAPSWADIGAILGQSTPLVSPSWGDFGPCWPCSADLGPTLGRSGVDLGPSRAHLRAISAFIKS